MKGLLIYDSVHDRFPPADALIVEASSRRSAYALLPPGDCLETPNLREAGSLLTEPIARSEETGAGAPGARKVV